MKRYLLILALCGSVQAGDCRLAEALEQAEFNQRQLQAQVARIEEQQEQIEEQLEDAREARYWNAARRGDAQGMIDNW